jgi:hypothetical protein
VADRRAIKAVAARHVATNFAYGLTIKSFHSSCNLVVRGALTLAKKRSSCVLALHPFDVIRYYHNPTRANLLARGAKDMPMPPVPSSQVQPRDSI